MGSKDALFGMGPYSKAVALGSGGAGERGRARKIASEFIFFFRTSEKAANWEKDWRGVSMQTLHRNEDTPWRGPAETLDPMKSRVLLTDFALFLSEGCFSVPHK